MNSPQRAQHRRKSATETDKHRQALRRRTTVLPGATLGELRSFGSALADADFPSAYFWRREAQIKIFDISLQSLRGGAVKLVLVVNQAVGTGTMAVGAAAG